MSMEKVIERIRVDSSGQASGIISSSRRQAEEILSLALIEAAVEQSRIRETGRRETGSRVAQILAQGRMEAREIIRSARDRVIARCFAKAQEELKRIPDTPAYPVILERLMIEGIDLMGGDHRRVRQEIQPAETRDPDFGSAPHFGSRHHRQVFFRKDFSGQHVRRSTFPVEEGSYI
jgi:vacuolar-type H+-ATPase subunit E/Vma4